MNPPDDNSLCARIDAKLMEILNVPGTAPGWSVSWKRLCPESTWQERLKVYQMIRDSGSLPMEAGFYLVCRHVDAFVDEYAGEALQELDDRIAAIRSKHGLGEDDFWGPGEGPAEYERLRQQHQDAWDRLFADKLDEYGEHEMARLLRADPKQFEQLTEIGRQFFFGPGLANGSDFAGWLDSLMEGVAEQITVDAESGPLKFRYLEEDGFWEVTAYPSAVELLGGAMDGEIVAPGFSLDLEGLRALFERIDDSGWSALGSPAEGPNVWIEGVREGREVLLRVLAHAPEDEEPGMKLDVSKNG